MADDGVPWLDAGEKRTWMALAGALEALPAVLNAQLRAAGGLNLFEYTILVGLSDSRDRTKAFGELATFACGSPSRMSHAVARLENRGWIRRGPHPDGGRALVLTLTDAGYAALVDLAPDHVREVRHRVIDPLSPDQVEALGQIALELLHASSPELAAMIEERADRDV